MKLENYYAILDGEKVVIVNDMDVWQKFFVDDEKRNVRKTTVGRFLVSTVFLGLNHGFGGQDLWFETMVFGKGMIDMDDVYMRRYATYRQALNGHAEVCEEVFNNFYNPWVRLKRSWEELSKAFSEHNKKTWAKIKSLWPKQKILLGGDGTFTVPKDVHVKSVEIWGGAGNGPMHKLGEVDKDAIAGKEFTITIGSKNEKE